MQNIQKIGNCKTVKFNDYKRDVEYMNKFRLSVKFNVREIIRIENENNKLYFVYIDRKNYIYNGDFKLIYKIGENMIGLSIKFVNGFILVNVNGKSLLFNNSEIVDKNIIIQDNLIFIDEMFIYNDNVYGHSERYYCYRDDILYMYIKINNVGHIFEYKHKLINQHWTKNDKFTNIPNCVNDEIFKNYINLQLEQIKLSDKLKDNEHEAFMWLPFNGKDYDYVIKKLLIVSKATSILPRHKELIKTLINSGGIDEAMFSDLIRLVKL